MKFDNDLLVRLRVSNHMTQSEFGEKVGVVRATVGAWENGTVSPNIAKINEISKIFGVQPKLFILD